MVQTSNGVVGTFLVMTMWRAHTLGSLLQATILYIQRQKLQWIFIALWAQKGLSLSPKARFGRTIHRQQTDITKSLGGEL